jgi:transcription initiation factor TFIID subunit 7
MNDRAPIRDRTLILRILVPGLEARLRDKMKETEDSAENKEHILDLEGVMCEPTTARNNTLWSFHCDGASYPALLVNLPCPVELHKTHDHAAYYKSADIAQMLIVYEDDMALEEATENAVDGFPSYYHSGLTPPMKRVVERRFAAREHNAVAPPRAAIADVEVELVELMEKIAKDEKGRRNKVPTLTSANKVLEEVVEEEVYFEPWMNDYGRQPEGVQFDADDQMCSVHPEVWLSPETIRQLKEEEEEARLKKQVAAEKKQAKRKKKNIAKEAEAAVAAAAGSFATSTTNTKKGIASSKNEEPMDDVTQAAMMIDIEDAFDGDNFLDLDFNDDDMLNLGNEFKDNTL